MIGPSVGPYRILRQLGSGGMGEVWLAEDSRLNRQVALKTVRPAENDAASRARLLREARAAAGLNHPNIAAVYDVLEEDGDIVVVFEYVEGETLHGRIARGPLPAAEAVEIGSQIAKALISAHAHGVVHRDLKPSNVIVNAEGHAKVLDFGIARVIAIGTTLTIGGSSADTIGGLGLIGTAGYAAPEQMVSSAVDERADLYALGVVLFEMISGHRPFVGNDPVQLATSKLGSVAPPLSSTGKPVPPALETLVASLLERDRDRRPGSASDVLASLHTVFGQRPVKQSRALLAAAGTLLIVILGGYAVSNLNVGKPSGAAATASPVIAVLPLTNMSGDASKDFIAAGIAESLISRLAPIQTITVLSRSSVAEARTRSTDPRKLVKDLGATYLIDGTVQESGGVYRISINLIRPDQSIAWADSVQGGAAEIFDLQNRLAVMVASALRVQVSPADRQRMNAPITTSAEALQKYWQARALFDRRDVSGNIDAAIAAYDEAITIDPSFALAHAALGEAFWTKYSDTRDASLAKQAADEGYTALRLDANAPQVRYTLAVTLAGTGKLDEAVGELRQALALQPNYDDARRQLGVVLATQGHVEDAIGEFDKAIVARPEAWLNYSAKGRSMYSVGRYKDAIAAFQNVIRLQPDNAAGFQQLGTAYQQIGENDLAVENYQKALAIRPSAAAYSNMGKLLHERGDFAAAVDAYQRSIRLRPNAAASHRNLGDTLMRLNKVREAKAEYLEAVRLGEADLKVNPTDGQALAQQAVYLQKSGQRDVAAERMRAAIASAPDNAEVLYRVAVVQVLSGNSELALKTLSNAIAKGYSARSVKSDDEWASLRNDSRFVQLIGEESK
jgi:serine/threonine protein kinase/Flp pilus assembly protein TadD